MSDSKKEINTKEILLEMTKIIQKICEENDINYFMIGGTFIGAVRHKGFIPWDDDVDLGMFRNDYEKFIEVCKSKLPQNYELFHYSTNLNVVEHFAKVINKDYIVEELRGENGNTILKNNLFIDIFPIDNYPDNKIKKLILNTKIKFLILKLHIRSLPITYKDGYNGKNLIKRILTKCQKINNAEYSKILKKYDEVSKMYKDEEYSENLINFCSRNGKTIYKKEKWKRDKIEKLKSYKFEDIELSGIENFDYFLRKRFGNYMKLPPIEEQQAKHYNNVYKVKGNK